MEKVVLIPLLLALGYGIIAAAASRIKRTPDWWPVWPFKRRS